MEKVEYSALESNMRSLIRSFVTAKAQQYKSCCTCGSKGYRSMDELLERLDDYIDENLGLAIASNCLLVVGDFDIFRLGEGKQFFCITPRGYSEQIGNEKVFHPHASLEANPLTADNVNERVAKVLAKCQERYEANKAIKSFGF